MSAEIIPIAGERAEKVETTSPPRPYPFARHRAAAARSARRYWRIARLIAEANGWIVMIGMIAVAIST